MSKAPCEVARDAQAAREGREGSALDGARFVAPVERQLLPTRRPAYCSKAVLLRGRRAAKPCVVEAVE